MLGRSVQFNQLTTVVKKGHSQKEELCFVEVKGKLVPSSPASTYYFVVVMNVSTLKLAVFLSAVFVCFSIILTDVCLLGRRECFPNPTELKEALFGSLARLPDTNQEESVLDSAKGLNHHVWELNCVKTIETLCNFPIFPKAPDRRQITFTTEITVRNRSVDGHRMLGYIFPNVTGEYYFAVVSNGFAEVWLSPMSSWRAAKQIAYITPRDVLTTINKWEFGSVKSQISNGIYLKARKRYYIEIIYAVGGRKMSESFLQVAWKRPRKSRFEIIEGESLLIYTNDSDMAKYKMLDDELPDAHYCSRYHKGYANKHMMPEVYPFLEHAAVNKALPFCDYRPSYLFNPSNLIDFKQYHGVHKYVHRTVSFPYPNIDGIVRSPKAHPVFWAENPLEEQEALSAVDRYMGAVEKAYPGKYELESIFRVEKKEDLQNEKRYFLELVVKDLVIGKRYILAEYVFQPKAAGRARLCYPKGLQWNRTAEVYLILTAKNLGRWVHHFIKNVEDIVQETQDEHLHVVIFDFDSPDIDLEQAFKKTTLKNYHFISKPGKYSRVSSFSEAIQSIKDPDAIVVTVDLHLDIGSQLINDIRKHCSKGRTVYAPQIVFLKCGGSSALPSGVWYHLSYGTIAMYKQDWDNFGGFSHKFTNKSTWGGEDWDIIDNAVRGGLEIERKRAPWVYHYHHTKAGMWS